jgi:protease IV
MNTPRSRLMVALVAVAVAGLAAGCGPGTGYIVRPIPADESLAEMVVQRDPGLFVSDKIALVDVSGLLTNGRSEGLFGSRENPVALFAEKLDEAQKDPQVRALVLRINSPGGGVTASDLMYRRLMEFKKERKIPVIAVIEDVGASGAYYLAMGADVIIVSPTSITGSIGVIVQTFSLAGTLDKLGIAAKAITSGPMKDMGSPFKPFDAADQKILQTLVDEFYARFLDIVATGRPKLSKDVIRKLADGRIYTGEQAIANGLADQAGDVNSAVKLAKERAGVKAARVVMYDRPWGYKANVYSTAPVPAASLNLSGLSPADVTTWFQPQFLYLWTGGGGGRE